MEQIVVREAAPVDAQAIRTLLAECRLGIDNILAPDTRYWLAEQPGADLVVGTIGLELGAGAALMRSAAVLPQQRGSGLGRRLVQLALNGAGQSGSARVYLFSTGAGAYWQRFGFVQVPVAEVVAALPLAPQVQRYDALGWLPTEVAWRLELV